MITGNVMDVSMIKNQKIINQEVWINTIHRIKNIIQKIIKIRN